LGVRQDAVAVQAHGLVKQKAYGGTA
jgi:hypothetical protein